MSVSQLSDGMRAVAQGEVRQAWSHWVDRRNLVSGGQQPAPQQPGCACRSRFLGPAVTPASLRRREQAVASSVQAAPTESRFSYCTARARRREYSSLEIAFEFFKRSSFSSSSATL